MPSGNRKRGSKGTVQADAELLRTTRLEKGLTQETLAFKAGCDKKSVENAEAGRNILPRILGEIAAALGLPREQLILKKVFAAASPPQAALPQIAASPTPSEYTLAPSRPQLFIGREEAIREVKARLGIGQRDHARAPIQVVTAMRGWPGVGKTTLAAWLANDPEVAAALPDGGPLWAGLGKDPDLFGELAAWGRAVGVDDLIAEKSVDRASKRLAPLLAKRQILLVIDDVWKLEHARPFLIGGPESATLVTTRSTAIARDLAPEGVYRLDCLGEQVSLELLACLVGNLVARHREKCTALVRALEGLPLALQVAGRLLRGQGSGGRSEEDLVALLDELCTGAALLERQAPPDMADVIAQTTPTVAALLQRSVETLDETTRLRFALLGVVPEKPATFSLKFLKRQWYTDNPWPTVEILVDRGLLEVAGEERFQMHSLLVTYARSLLRE